MTYYMISRRTQETNSWQECKASTLLGAKREATAEYAGRFRDAVLVIAEGNNVTDPRREITTKSNAPGSRWIPQE